jgi:uncharacterized protein
MFKRLCLLFLLLLPCVAAQAALPARPAGPVYDGANIIPAETEAAIDGKLRALSKDTGKTLVVATVPTLGDMEIEEYAVRMFETWGIGDAEKDEGALILVAPNQRKTRIEVGLGSEGVLPDALAGRIIEQQMIPAFKAGDFGSGISQAADAVEAQLRREPTDARAVAAAAERAQAQRGSGEGGGIGLIIFWLFILFFFIFPIIGAFARGGKKYRGRGRRSDWAPPVIIWGGGGSSWGGSSGSSWGGGFGGGFGGFGGGISGGGGASGGW